SYPNIQPNKTQFQTLREEEESRMKPMVVDYLRHGRIGINNRRWTSTKWTQSTCSAKAHHLADADFFNSF
ncbi:hypothetical protein HAX54_012910, partial [Datura stramonium]|nr:hypothetical protein [Datura stramonium]